MDAGLSETRRGLGVRRWLSGYCLSTSLASNARCAEPLYFSVDLFYIFFLFSRAAGCAMRRGAINGEASKKFGAMHKHYELCGRDRDGWGLRGVAYPAPSRSP